MKKNIYLFLIIFFSFFLAGCSLADKIKTASQAPAGQSADSDQQLIGGDKDEHGCIGSAGYTWCQEKQKCLRTWEELCIDK